MFKFIPDNYVFDVSGSIIVG